MFVFVLVNFAGMVSSRAEIYTLFRCKLKINKASDGVKRRREIESAGLFMKGCVRCQGKIPTDNIF